MDESSVTNKPKTKEECDRKDEEHKHNWRTQCSRQGVERRCAELAEVYGVKKGEVIRYLLWIGLDWELYQQMHPDGLQRMERNRQWREEREAERLEQERQERASLPVEERTYEHLRLIKSA